MSNSTSRAPYTHAGPRSWRSSKNRTLMVRFKEVDEKGVMVFVEFIETSQAYTMAGSLPTETIGRSLVFHGAIDPL